MTRDQIQNLSEAERRAWLGTLTDQETLALAHYWPYFARAEQLEPPRGKEPWVVWLIEAGRGFGKTRTGAEWILSEVSEGRARRVALIARTAGDVRDVMVEGESGILARSHPSWRPVYEPSRRRLTWPNGSVATTYTSEEPSQLRGPEHDLAWGDEVASWRYEDAYDNMRLGLRLGEWPRACLTTTPRPNRLMRNIRSEPTTVRTVGTTFDNQANLPLGFLAAVQLKYSGTRLGRQELFAEVLEEVEGALWTSDMIDEARVPYDPPFARVVVAIDPATTSKNESNETGIIAAGLGKNGEYYVLEDKSGRYSPNKWAYEACALAIKLRADRVVAETNQGGDMIESTLRSIDPHVAYRGVHARRGKYLRAEPVAALYEQGKVHHIGILPELEEQMCSWVPGEDSPDRLDALVYALTELLARPTLIVSPSGETGQSTWRI